MGVNGTGWGGVMVNEVDPACVIIIAMPTHLVVPSGPENPTRVYAIHVTGPQALRDILKEAGPEGMGGVDGKKK